MSLNYLENREILPSTIIEVIDIMISISVEIVFCGSISLIESGILKRPIKDVDVIVPKNSKLEDFGLLDLINLYSGGNYIVDKFKDIDGKEIIRNSFFINNIKVDVFKIENINYRELPFYDKKIKIQKIEDVILYKKAWALFGIKSSKKHIDDLREIEQNIKNS